MKWMNFILAMILATVQAALGQEAVNLLKNAALTPGSGKDVPGWTFSTWNLPPEPEKKAEIEWGPHLDANGNRSLHLVSQASEKVFVWWQQQIPAKGGATYTVRFHARGLRKANASSQKFAGMGAGFYFLGPNGKWIGYQGIQGGVLFSEDWENYQDKVTTPDEATIIGIRFSIQGNVPMEAYFGDIVLAEEQKN